MISFFHESAKSILISVVLAKGEGLYETCSGNNPGIHRPARVAGNTKRSGVPTE
jgi:hypothetical protein